MSVQILQADCRRALRTLTPASFDLAIVDPPYGQTSLRWDRRIDGWADLVLPLLKPSGSMWVFGSLRMFMECADGFARWRMSHDVVWEKHNGSGFHRDRFRRVHEHAVHFYPRHVRWSAVYKATQFTNDATRRTIRKKARPAHWTGARAPTVYRSVDGGPRLMRSVLFHRSEHGRALHPTQKPLALIESLVRFACPTGGTILDPFAGSGSVGVVAARLGCSAVLIEASRRYARACHQRLESEAAA